LDCPRLKQGTFYSITAIQPFVWPWPLFQFLNLYTVGRIPWTGDQPVARPLPTHRKTQTQNKCKETSMSRVVFEPTTTVFERVKRVDALDLAATVIGKQGTLKIQIIAVTRLTVFGRQPIEALERAMILVSSECRYNNLKTVQTVIIFHKIWCSIVNGYQCFARTIPIYPQVPSM
jgi:hypothetical protein